MVSAEPLLEPDRLQLLPIKYDDIWRMYKQAEASFWTTEEVDLGNDRRDYETLTEPEQYWISHVLAFFATADGLVFDNIDANFGEEVQIREAKMFYGFQRSIEGIHNEMYSLMITSLIAKEEDQNKIFSAVSQFGALKKKTEWAQLYMDRSQADFGTRLVAFIIMEYIFFSASFAAIFYFKKRNKMHGLCFSNELISRDEGLHAQFGCLLYNNYLRDKPSEEKILQMVKAAVDIECEFVKESLPVRFLGMNAELMCAYVKSVADHMLISINIRKHYEIKNPFEWMELISLTGKTNFFEKRVGEYSKAGVGGELAEAKFSLDEDF
jgi:ribonucleotide reductase beta subunit family protein with ferritin-like domain